MLEGFGVAVSGNGASTGNYESSRVSFSSEVNSWYLR